MFTFTTGSGVRLAAILLRVLGEGVANALLGPFGALGVLNQNFVGNIGVCSFLHHTTDTLAP